MNIPNIYQGLEVEPPVVRLVIELKENGDINIYSEIDVDLTIIDWKDVREDANTLFSWERRELVKDAERELLHKTTGLKQVYP